MPGSNNSLQKKLPDLSFLDSCPRKAKGNKSEGKFVRGSDKDESASMAKPTHRDPSNCDPHRTNLPPKRESTVLTTLISQDALTRDGIPQREALKQAKTWFDGATVRLKERLELAEEMSASLTEFLQVLTILDRVQAGTGPGSESDQTSPFYPEETTQKPLEMIAEQQISSDTTEVARSEESEVSNDNPVVRGVGERSKSTNTDNSQGTTELEAVSHAANEWLRRVRILRAKWTAGGRNMERWTGTRN